MTQNALKFRQRPIWSSLFTGFIKHLDHCYLSRRESPLPSLIWHSFMKIVEYLLYLLRAVVGNRTRSNKGQITCLFFNNAAKRTHLITTFGVDASRSSYVRDLSFGHLFPTPLWSKRFLAHLNIMIMPGPNPGGDVHFVQGPPG